MSSRCAAVTLGATIPAPGFGMPGVGCWIIMAASYMVTVIAIASAITVSSWWTFSAIEFS